MFFYHCYHSTEPWWFLLGSGITMAQLNDGWVEANEEVNNDPIPVTAVRWCH